MPVTGSKYQNNRIKLSMNC